MSEAEFHQQQLEQQEQGLEYAVINDEEGREMRFHIYGDDGFVHVHVSSWPIKFDLHMNISQANMMVRLLDNALRRAK